MRQLGLLSCLVLVACSGSPKLIVPELPDDIDFIAALSFDGDQLVASSGLMPRQELGTTLDVHGRPNGRFVIVGYAQSDLAALFAESPRTNAPLSLATPTDPVLPTPRFTSEWPTRSAAPTTLRELTAGWLLRCPVVFEPGQSYYGDLSCAARRCGMEFQQNADCSFSINTGACLAGTLEGVVDGRGAMSVSNSEFLQDCRRIEARPFAAASIQCVAEEQLCVLDAVLAPTAPRLDAEPLRIYDVASVPDLQLGSPPLGAYLGGWAFLTQSQAVVLGFAGKYRPRASGVCERAELSFVDLPSLAIVRTATTIPCVDALGSTPEGTTFFAATATPTALLEFDARGRVLRERALPKPKPWLDFPEVNAVLRIVADPERVYIVFAESLDVYAIDRASFDLAWVSELPDRPIAVEGLFGDERAAQLSVVLESDAVQIIDAETGRLGAASNIARNCRLNSIFPSSSRVDETLAVRITTAYDAPNATENPELLIASLDEARCDRLSFYEASAEAFTTSTLEDGRLVAGLFDPSTKHTYFALADPETARFLPGAVRVDQGAAPWRSRSTEHGVFALLPASAQVVKITLR